MPILEREYELGLASQVALPEVDEATARRDLRDQIARLEAQVGAAVSAGFPHLPAPAAGRHAAAARLLDLGALERARDDLADRLRAVRRQAEALGARQAASRRLLERMRLEPGRYRWVRVYAADLGEPGCQSWQVRPRLGLLGMLLGWWRVKLSSGCPLATAGIAGRGVAPGASGSSAVRDGLRHDAEASSPSFVARFPSVGYDTIVAETRGSVALLTLNRPDRLNAWTPQMAAELADAIARANDDDAVGAIVVTGAGGGFCAGADMEETFKSRIDGRDPGGDTAEGSGGMPKDIDWVGLARDAKPLIAAVNGAAVGIGLTMILPFDVILASERARFGMLFIKVGLVPELASTHLLSHRVGIGHAGEMCLTGRIVDAAEAAAMGLADRLVAADDLLTEALALGEAIAANPAPQLRMIKRLLTENASETDLDAVQRRESELLRECWRSPEHHEAVQAFLDARRRPRADVQGRMRGGVSVRPSLISSRAERRAL